MTSSAPLQVTHEQVTTIVGHMDDEYITAIVDSGASADDVLAAFTWFNSEEAIAQDPGHHMTDQVRRIYAILARAQGEDEERRP